jgi:hypothetical protein
MAFGHTPKKSALAAEPQTAVFQRKTGGVTCDGSELVATNGNGLQGSSSPRATDSQFLGSELQIKNSSWWKLAEGPDLGIR